MIENILNRLERFFEIKRPSGKFSRYNLYGDVPNADFVDDDVVMEFRETDTTEIVDVRFFNPKDYDNHSGYAWNILSADYEEYYTNGPKISMAEVMLERIRFLHNNALSFIENIGEDK